MRKSTPKRPRETMGTDLGDRFSHAYAFDPATGEVLGERRVQTRVEDVEELFAGLPPVRIVMETGTHANWVARLAARHGHEVVVGQARLLRMIYENPTKSDAVDARMLADLGATHPDLLHPVRVRDERTQANLAVLRGRATLIAARTQLINSARGLTKSLGYRLPSCSTAAFARRAWEACPERLAPALRPMLRSAAVLTRQIAGADREVARLCHEVYRKQTKRLLEVDGVGEITALAYVLVIGDPARFPHTRDVGAFLGLVPRRAQSCGSDPQLPITKCGDAMVRRLLAQSAQYILGPFGKDCDLRTWGLAHAVRGGKNAKKRAVTAVTRRLAVLLLSLGKNDVPYDPQHNAKRAAAAAAEPTTVGRKEAAA